MSPSTPEVVEDDLHGNNPGPSKEGEDISIRTRRDLVVSLTASALGLTREVWVSPFLLVVIPLVYRPLVLRQWWVSPSLRSLPHSGDIPDRPGSPGSDCSLRTWTSSSLSLLDRSQFTKHVKILSVFTVEPRVVPSSLLYLLSGKETGSSSLPL